MSAVAVRTATKTGIYGDGAGLWLTIGPAAAKMWLCPFMLAEAREKALPAHKMLLEGLDPLAARQAARAAKAAGEALELAGRVRFRDAAERYIAANKADWKSEKHAAQWGSALEA